MMETKIYQCPKCKKELNFKNNTLVCINKHKFQVTSGIPRFVKEDNYAKNFGLEWGRFAKTQVDTFAEVKQSEIRIKKELGWTPEFLKGKLILDAGCGSGRFSEVFSRWGAKVIALDYSKAVDSAKQTLNDPNITFVQGNLLNLPFKDNTFDLVSCVGVIQHTPSPLDTINEMYRVLKPGGMLGLWGVLEKTFLKVIHPRYIYHPILKLVPEDKLFYIVEKWVKVGLPINRFLRKKLKLKAGIAERITGVLNYEGLVEGVTEKNSFELSLLDTYDMYSPKYVIPVSRNEIIKRFKKLGMKEIRSMYLEGIVYTAIK